MNPPFPNDTAGIEALIELALDEDIGGGDLTTIATIEEGATGRAEIVTREDCVVSGLALFDLIADAVDRRNGCERVHLERSVNDGDRIAVGDEVCVIAGALRTLFTMERVFLNFLGRMSGIATLTAEHVAAVRATGSETRVLDTRKTTPGHRVLEKYAVLCGGGANHRMGLYDAVLIKDNHVAGAGGIREAVRSAIETAPDGVSIEVECDRLDQVHEAIAAGATAILLDNFTPDEAANAVKEVGGRARLEVSGGINLTTIADYARAGVDDISVGALTHSAVSVDLSMELKSGGT